MTVFSANQRLWLFGCGNMVGAMLERWLATGIDPAAITVIDPHRDQVPAGIRLVASPPDDEGSPRAVIVGVEPQIFSKVAPGLSDRISVATAVISVMAGIRCDAMASAFPATQTIVRTMPNLPVSLGKGVTIAFAKDEASTGDAAVDELLKPLGTVLRVKTEDLVDVGTAVSGSGPAFVYRFIDAIAAAAEMLGFSSEDAQQLALGTVAGSAELALLADISPKELADRVASRGGTTRAGLDVLDRDPGIYNLMFDTLTAARTRSLELAKLAEA